MWNYLLYFGMIALIRHQSNGKVAQLSRSSLNLEERELVHQARARQVPGTFGCHKRCQNRGGYCPKVCGQNAFCCRKGYNSCPPVFLEVSPLRNHACIEMKDSGSARLQQVIGTFGCQEKCGKRGGYCPKACGPHALCCRKGSNDCPPKFAQVSPQNGHACIKMTVSNSGGPNIASRRSSCGNDGLQSAKRRISCGDGKCNCGGNNQNNNNYCFPSNTYVRTKDGFPIQMEDVKVGDIVLTIDETGQKTYSEVIMLLHKNKDEIINDYVKISTKDGFELILSTYHLIPISSVTSSRFVYGKDVRHGDNVTVYNPSNKKFHPSQVASVELVTKRGAYAPLTMDGTVVVNDVYASCYASYPNHDVAHFAFSMWRWLYTHVSSLLNMSTDDKGIHWYPRMLMSLNSIIGY